MPILNTYNRLFWSGVRLPHRQLKLAYLDFGLCLTVLVVVFAWITQIIFWRMVGWEVSYRMNLSWVALPISSYFFASAAVASIGTTTRAYLGGLLPTWLLEFGWVALTSIFIALSILNQSIFLFSFSAGLFGAGLFPLLRQATLLFSQKQPKIPLIGATFFGVAVGVITTSGNLFADQHLLQLAIAFFCCLTIAVTAMRVQTMLSGHDEEPAKCLPGHAQHRALSDSFIQAGCGILIAAPIAIAPTLEALCGIGLAGFSFGFMTHYGAMLLPSFFVNKWRHTFSSYAFTGAYVISLTFGHILPLLYLSRVDWW
jgi:hypothetical protein